MKLNADNISPSFFCWYDCMELSLCLKLGVVAANDIKFFLRCSVLLKSSIAVSALSFSNNETMRRWVLWEATVYGAGVISNVYSSCIGESSAVEFLRKVYLMLFWWVQLFFSKWWKKNFIGGSFCECSFQIWLNIWIVCMPYGLSFSWDFWTLKSNLKLFLKFVCSITSLRHYWKRLKTYSVKKLSLMYFFIKFLPGCR